MTKISNLADFKNITSSITSFSHAYLFNVNSLLVSFSYIKDFAKQIILQNIEENSYEYDDINYKIDNDLFDDLYIVNPQTIGINNEEITKLLTYMETKSTRIDGRRVYIIYGFERLTRDISNKILKFLEEPNDNIYALLMTENLEKILPTIVSRCQVMNFSFAVEEQNIDDVIKCKRFFDELLLKKKQMIAYTNEYFNDISFDRLSFYNFFQILENIISNTLNKKYGSKFNEIYISDSLLNYTTKSIIEALNITNKLKCLIRSNINLNLLLDRYIIEITEVLVLCKK